MRPIFFLQTPHLFFFGLLGLDFSDGVSDATEQIESSFLRFELDEGIGVLVEFKELFVIGTGALLAITFALLLFEGDDDIWELFGVVVVAVLFEEELVVDIAIGVVGFKSDFTAVLFSVLFSCAFFIFSSRFLSSAL